MLFFKSKAEKKAEAEAKERERKQAEINAKVSGTLDPQPYLGSNDKKRNDKTMAINMDQNELRGKLKEAVTHLYKEVNRSLEDERTIEKVQDLMDRLARVDLGMDPGITRTIVGFFLEQINAAVLRAQEKNVGAVTMMVSDLDGLLSELMDHRNSAELFSNPEYVDRRLRVASLSATLEGYEGQLARAYKTRDDIKALLESGAISQQQAMDRVQRVKDDVEAIKRNKQRTRDTLATVELGLAELKQQILNSAKEQEKDLAANEDIIAQKEDAEERSNEYASQRDQLRTNNSAVSSDRMGFNSTSSDTAEMSEEAVAQMFDF